MRMWLCFFLGLFKGVCLESNLLGLFVLMYGFQLIESLRNVFDNSIFCDCNYFEMIYIVVLNKFLCICCFVECYVFVDMGVVEFIYCFVEDRKVMLKYECYGY